MPFMAAIPAVPGRNTSGFHRPGRGRLGGGGVNVNVFVVGTHRWCDFVERFGCSVSRVGIGARLRKEGDEFLSLGRFFRGSASGDCVLFIIGVDTLLVIKTNYWYYNVNNRKDDATPVTLLPTPPPQYVTELFVVVLFSYNGVQ